MLLDTVVFLAVSTFLSVVVLSGLCALASFSSREDARVQAIMASRVKMEELRSQTSWTPGEEVFSVEGLDMIGYGTYSIREEEPGLYEILIRVYDKKGAELYSTKTFVWQE